MDAPTTQQDVLTVKEGLAGRLRLNRPKALHSLNRQMVRDMANALIAWRNGSMPLTSVYLVWPLRRASTAAALICSGVSKSGSPAEKLTTSTPSVRSLPALAAIASVTEGLTSLVRSASRVMKSSLTIKFLFELS